MQRTPKRSSKRRLPIWVWFALSLLAGLLIGWFALGWGIWPAGPKDAQLSDLRTPEREAYLTMVAESFAADGNRALARQKVESWSSDALTADIGRLAGDKQTWMRCKQVTYGPWPQRSGCGRSPRQPPRPQSRWI